MLEVLVSECERRLRGTHRCLFFGRETTVDLCTFSQSQACRSLQLYSYRETERAWERHL